MRLPGGRQGLDFYSRFMEKGYSTLVRPCSAGYPNRRSCLLPYRISLKQFRTSRTNVSGCSKAAKCPPLLSSLKYTSLANLFSAHRLDVRNISFGKIEQPTGTVTGSVSVRRKLSQYNRADDA